MKGIITYSPELQNFLDTWHRADELNDANAQFDLAKCLLKSKQMDARKKAFALFKKLSNQSYTTVQTNAQFMLGKCYENGYGITKSYPRAIRWYKLSGQNISNDLVKNPDPVGEAASIAFERSIEEQSIDDALDYILYGKITPELIDCITESADGGDVNSQKYLMDLYNLGGKGVEPDDAECAYWAEKAAENGNPDAMNKIGRMYYFGQGVVQDYEKSLYWLEKAAKHGKEYAAYLIGKYYESQKKYKEAAKWYREYAQLYIKWRNKRLGWKDLG